MDRKAIKQGFSFEKYISNVLDLKLQPGSGNKFFAKNDAIGHGLSVSCKSERLFSWTQIKRYLRQSIDDAHGSGNMPVLALEDKSDNNQLVVMRLQDFAKALNGGVTSIPGFYESKGVRKRNEADIPVMLRNSDLEISDTLGP